MFLKCKKKKHEIFVQFLDNEESPPPPFFFFWSDGGKKSKFS
jgi:hypothetical protein